MDITVLNVRTAFADPNNITGIAVSVDLFYGPACGAIGAGNESATTVDGLAKFSVVAGNDYCVQSDINGTEIIEDNQNLIHNANNDTRDELISLAAFGPDPDGDVDADLSAFSIIVVQTQLSGNPVAGITVNLFEGAACTGAAVDTFATVALIHGNAGAVEFYGFDGIQYSANGSPDGDATLSCFDGANPTLTNDPVGGTPNIVIAEGP